MELDGNGWVQCACGARHWGKHGAAGLFLVVEGRGLLQLRPKWAHEGGTWAIPGGARDSHETVVAGALREAQEETALDPSLVTVHGVHRFQHPDWRYDTVLASCDALPEVAEHAESVLLEWVPLAEIAMRDLHPGFAATLPQLLLPRVALVVDAANVVGSRPDGWWKDRAGAAQRLIDRLELIAGRVVRLDGEPVLLAQVEVVLEGRARAVSDQPLDALVQIVRAAGSGDDAVVERSRRLTDVLVVTSDRGLRARVASSVGVSVLRGWLEA
ncbi:MAG: NUDIX hydrolase [Candidatus Nanopelagicales bacterium]